MILAVRSHNLGKPSHGFQSVIERHWLGNLEPGPVYQRSAIDVVHRLTVLQAVVGGDHLRSPPEFSPPFTIGLHAIACKGSREFLRAVGEGATATIGGLR